MRSPRRPGSRRPRPWLWRAAVWRWAPAWRSSRRTPGPRKTPTGPMKRPRRRINAARPLHSGRMAAVDPPRIHSEPVVPIGAWAPGGRLVRRALTLLPTSHGGRTTVPRTRITPRRPEGATKDPGARAPRGDAPRIPAPGARSPTGAKRRLPTRGERSKQGASRVGNRSLRAWGFRRELQESSRVGPEPHAPRSIGPCRTRPDDAWDPPADPTYRDRAAAVRRRERVTRRTDVPDFLAYSPTFRPWLRLKQPQGRSREGRLAA